ncbi:phytoene desaturase family protein [Porphyromonadaceae sp. NP-X]|nr:phytoene desaturase family protein [Porphyromonadaceae sp. NP-X]
MKEKVIIVGAGLGGLATGLRLAKEGYEVEFLEKNDKAGGRLNQIKKDGFTFDTGPSFFSMSYIFKEFAEKCGLRLPFEFIELDPLYSVNFSGEDKTYFLYKDIHKLAKQFQDVEPDFEQKMEKYLQKSAQLFNDTVDIVIKRNFDSYLDYFLALIKVNPVHLPILFKTFWEHVNDYFTSKEAREIISLVAFFLGRTPFDTMGIYSLLSHVEFRHDGYYNVKGGMYKIVEGMLEELSKLDVKFHYETEIVDYHAENQQIVSLKDAQGNFWKANKFVINADAALFRSEVMKYKKFSEEKLDKMEWTMGYLTFYLGLKCKLPQVNHHNYFLGSNYEQYASNILQNPNTLEKPYYYVNVVSKYNPECAPEGCESLFFVCPVPNLKYKADWSDRDKIVNSIIDDFSQRIKKDISTEIISKTIFTPQEWQDKFSLYRGSGLGLSHKFTQIGAFRPKNHDEKHDNLFYVGASTIPGAGLPMAVISAELVVERILANSQ